MFKLDQFASDTFQSALDADSIINTHPISVPVHNPTEINEIFDGISYDKVIHVLLLFLLHLFFLHFLLFTPFLSLPLSPFLSFFFYSSSSLLSFPTIFPFSLTSNHYLAVYLMDIMQQNINTFYMKVFDLKGHSTQNESGV